MQSRFLPPSLPAGFVALFVALAVAGAGLASPPSAHADGAFPDGQSILLPRDRPRQIVLAVTFGLVFSEDDGATWAYSCEVPETATGRLYSVGAPPNHRLHAVSDLGAPVSNDDACRWTVGVGMLAGAQVLDVFPDPVDPQRVLAIARPPGAGSSLASVFRSVDGGFTYDTVLYEPPPDSEVTGVEIAASAPDVVYVTFFQRPGLHPRMARSSDGGASWSVIDLEPELGMVSPYLAAVDPVDPQKIYLRIKSAAVAVEAFEALAISSDGGQSWSTPVVVSDGVLTAFLRRQHPGETLLVAATVGTAPVGYRSDDGGQSFVDWPLSLHVRGLGERGSAIYVAADNARDGFAAGRSDDGGDTWRPILRFRDIGGVRPCVRDICQADCDNYAGLQLFPPETCNPPPDGGGGGGAGGAGGRGGSGGGGCGCALLSGRATMDGAGAAGGALLLVAAAGARSRRRRTNRLV